MGGVAKFFLNVRRCSEALKYFMGWFITLQQEEVLFSVDITRNKCRPFFFQEEGRVQVLTVETAVAF